MTKSIYIYNTCIYTYMHVCICTRMDVFVTILECNVKSRSVALRIRLLQVHQSVTHHKTTVIYIFSGYIQEEAGSRAHHWPPVIIVILGLVCHSLVFLRLIG